MTSVNVELNRRRFCLTSVGAAAAGLGGASLRGSVPRATRRFTLDLSPGAIGVRADLEETVALAARFGFESIYANASQLAGLDDRGRGELSERMASNKIVWGAAGLPVEFRKDELRFKEDLKRLPKLAAGLQQAGVTRVGTWLRPYHDELTYVSNFRQHAARLRKCIQILNDHNLRFGMEYVGPRTLWASKRYSFIHSLAELRELISEIDKPNVGCVLDSWHWYTAEETIDDLRSLSNEDIVACDLNDAPMGLSVDQQIDNQRELPAATGVIDLKAFLSVLVDIGYDGPIRAEPFNARLNSMNNEQACEATATAMKKAFALVSH